MSTKRFERGGACGSAWIGAFFEDAVKRILEIPEEIRVVELLPIGYPISNEPVARNRLALDAIVRRETW